MDDRLKIYVDRLKDGHTEKIQLDLPPNFLEVDEAELCFNENIAVKGDIYLAQNDLILHLQLDATCSALCAICNEKNEFPIAIPSIYHVEQLDDIKGAVFCLESLLRETLLLEIPPFFECHQGQCPGREQLTSFLKKDVEKVKEEEGINPFAHLSFKDSKIVENS
ncbi:MAG: hypothetical protein JHC93_07295 [Parachlamydiales bacterium]|nr:hypothetical protein [Parachlamydiales bacterium]